MRKWCVGAIVMAMLAAPTFAACPNKCSGHGSCGKNDVCICMQNWTGGDCSGRVCPYTRAWQDTAEADDDGHYYAECGNRGLCDRDKGVCDCDDPFTGSGCRRLGCPADCSGHGTCEFIEELAGDGYDRRINGAFGRKYTLWDQEKIMGCRCDAGFEGHNCAKRVCPKGDDPLTVSATGAPIQTEMLQAIELNLIAGVTGFLTYFDPYGNAWTTERIDFSTNTCGNIQTALQRLPNNVLNTVAVTGPLTTSYLSATRASKTSDIGTPTTVVIAGTITVCQVAFPSEAGTTGKQNLLGCDVSVRSATGQHPMLTGLATATCTVSEMVPAGTTTRPLSELAECSNRGTCDATTGTCKCFAGHMGLACQTQEALV